MSREDLPDLSDALVAAPRPSPNLVPPPRPPRRSRPDTAASGGGSRQTRSQQEEVGKVRSYGARLPESLVGKLRARAAESQVTYSSVLGWAFGAHQDSLRTQERAWGSSPGGWRVVTRSHTTAADATVMVQFRLTAAEADLIRSLGAETGRSFAATVRELLGRYLT